MDYTLINQYGIIVLVIIFICVNIYYKNIINVLIFLICFLGLRNMMTEHNALFLAYIIALVYGIVKNFHLFENFKVFVGKPQNNGSSMNNVNNVTNDNINNVNNVTNDNINNVNNVNNMNNESIDSSLSDELFINHNILTNISESDNSDFLYISPSLIVTEDDINCFFNALENILNKSINMNFLEYIFKSVINLIKKS